MKLLISDIDDQEQKIQLQQVRFSRMLYIDLFFIKCVTKVNIESNVIPYTTNILLIYYWNTSEILLSLCEVSCVGLGHSDSVCPENFIIVFRVVISSKFNVKSE